MILSILVAGHLQVLSHAKHVLFIIMSNYGFPCFPFDFLCSFYSSWISWQLDYNLDPSSYAVKYGVFRELSKGSWSQKIPYLSECLLIFLNLSFFYFFFLRNYWDRYQISTYNLFSLPRPGYFFQQGQCITEESVQIVSVRMK